MPCLFVFSSTHRSSKCRAIAVPGAIQRECAYFLAVSHHTQRQGPLGVSQAYVRLAAALATCACRQSQTSLKHVTCCLNTVVCKHLDNKATCWARPPSVAPAGREHYTDDKDSAGTAAVRSFMYDQSNCKPHRRSGGITAALQEADYTKTMCAALQPCCGHRKMSSC